jgi:etoposide-induced 2.4 mRNA
MRDIFARVIAMGLPIVEAALAGLRDSFKLHRAGSFFTQSKHIQDLAIQCFKLNGAIFLSSVLFLNWILQPILAHIISARVPEDGLLETLFTWMLRLLWVFPIYCISFILSGVWYQDIADETFLLVNKEKKADAKPLPRNQTSFQHRFIRMLSEELYRSLVVSIFLLQCTACSFIPYTGQILSTAMMTWLCSLYSFEYKWSLEGWPLEAKLRFFELNWAYMAGFGLPAALVNWYFPQFVNYGIYALVFPIFIMMAIIAKPPDNSPTSHTPSRYVRLPVFRLSKWISTMVLRVVCRYQRRERPS